MVRMACLTLGLAPAAQADTSMFNPDDATGLRECHCMPVPVCVIGCACVSGRFFLLRNGHSVLLRRACCLVSHLAPRCTG